MKKLNLGYRPLKLEQLMISNAIPKKHSDEKIIVHFVLENNYRSLHVQLERRIGSQISFERILINQD